MPSTRLSNEGPLTRSHRCSCSTIQKSSTRSVVSTLGQEHSSRLGHPLHSSHFHAGRFYSPQARFGTVLDSMLPFACCRACSRPATTLTCSEFNRLTSPEDHNVYLLLSSKSTQDFKLCRSQEMSTCCVPRIALATFCRVCFASSTPPKFPTS